jgi:hypothetical protein
MQSAWAGLDLGLSMMYIWDDAGGSTALPSTPTALRVSLWMHAPTPVSGPEQCHCCCYGLQGRRHSVPRFRACTARLEVSAAPR